MRCKKNGSCLQIVLSYSFYRCTYAVHVRAVREPRHRQPFDISGLLNGNDVQMFLENGVLQSVEVYESGTPIDLQRFVYH